MTTGNNLLSMLALNKSHYCLGFSSCTSTRKCIVEANKKGFDLIRPTCIRCDIVLLYCRLCTKSAKVNDMLAKKLKLIIKNQVISTSWIALDGLPFFLILSLSLSYDTLK